jgi:UDP-N-acetylglucosamine 2-epimerase (non-hydrolysing)
MRRFEPVVDGLQPACVIVVGDVNSTIACGLVAVKRGVPLVHVEAGLRSFDRSMPEEINRLLTDQIADVLYTTEPSAHANLVREGIAPHRIHFVGNVMIDSLNAHRKRALPPEETLRRAGISPGVLNDPRGFGVVTLHRPSNVDQADTLAAVLGTLASVSDRIPLVCPLHPRTSRNIERFGLTQLIAGRRMVLMPPQGYLEMIGLLASATLVLTDSGGVQEETTALGIPCLTLRENTERPVTVDQGTNTLVGCDRARALAAVDEVLATGGKRGRMPELWDGRAANRIAEHLATWLATQAPTAVR